MKSFLNPPQFMLSEQDTQVTVSTLRRYLVCHRWALMISTTGFLRVSSLKYSGNSGTYKQASDLRPPPRNHQCHPALLDLCNSFR